MIIPKDSIMVSSLLVVEYMDPEGRLHVESEAVGSDADALDISKTLELIEHARCEAIAPILVQSVIDGLGPILGF